MILDDYDKYIIYKHNNTDRRYDAGRPESVLHLVSLR
jgi:hypothetical protein